MQNQVNWGPQGFQIRFIRSMANYTLRGLFGFATLMVAAPVAAQQLPELPTPSSSLANSTPMTNEASPRRSNPAVPELQGISGAKAPQATGSNTLDEILKRQAGANQNSSAPSETAPLPGGASPLRPPSRHEFEAAPLAPVADPVQQVIEGTAEPANGARPEDGSVPDPSVQPASFLDPMQQAGMRSGIVTREAPASPLGLMESNSAGESTTAQQPAPLNPIEARYGKWWRDALLNAEVEGEFLEVYQVLQTVPASERAQVLAAYWQIAEAMAEWQIQKEGLQLWQSAVGASVTSQLLTEVGRGLEDEITLAQQNVERSQVVFQQLAARYGLPHRIRPADAPFLGSYGTKISELQLTDSQLATWATEIEQNWKSINEDVRRLEWADAQWRMGTRVPEQMAAIFQLRQRNKLLLVRRVTRYNRTIGRYALAVGGYGKSTEAMVAMLLRQPVIGGVVMDTRTDPLFRNDLQNRTRTIAQVDYQGAIMAGQAVPAGMNQSLLPDGTPVRASMNGGLVIDDRMPSVATPFSPGMTGNTTRFGQSPAGAFRRPASQIVPSHAGAWQAAQQANATQNR